MKQVSAFASHLRLNAMLCCSAAVLLSACGGATTESQQSSTAAQVSSDSGPAVPAPAPGNSAGLPDTAAGTGNAPGTASTAATGAAADVTPQAFELNGYDSNPLESRAGQEEEGATPPASTTDGATRLLAASVATPATTYNYYVSPTGSDTAAGTKAAPFKTLARAAKAATKASTTVWVAPGTYAGGIKTTANGSATGRIYWVSATKWGAKIVPPAQSANNSAWDNRGHYVSIIGFDVDGSKLGTGTKWVHGIYTGGSYNVIQGNRVHHLATTIPCNSAGGSAIGVDSYYKGVMGDVIGNVVHDIGPAGCTYVQGIYHSTSGSIVNNLVYRVGSAAIHLWHDATNVKIINNTVTSSVFGIIVGGGDFYFTSAGANNVFVYNNIVYDNKYGISEQGKTGTANKYANNLVFQNSTYNISLRNGLKASNTVSSNPLFAGYSRTAALPDYRPGSSSPAIGRGIATYAPATDIDGRPRNTSTGYDLGAYQH
ncbi:right-handed parallel beta-helix repeat-containing protein [Massilia oculi]|uniref:Right-handed parallel beta-helix repeat-containing protein n=1 Tax=Massilia hydrophila TaxID=3044279 RepID=A0ABS7YBE1_9BURK|nr:right-handed parallel beta-helix repeat-containing protein [Massilia oculi]MCA1856266.1 right-handed parallel beta-helix repeat-containing protein [Massilia oculi]